MKLTGWCSLWLLLGVNTGIAAAESSFESIAPLLKQHCISCHSGKTPASGLSLATLEGALAGGKRGPAIQPGNSAASLIVQFVKGEQSPRMPVGSALPAEVVARISAAIDAMPAAKAPAREAHLEWLLRPVRKPSPPAATGHPIDAFIQARLKDKGLTSAPPAERRALIRRVSFDLIGLPPTPAEMDAFVKDQSPDAYEKLIDRLLADPRYGERWGRHWLDLVRFAESDGFAIDGERPTAWRYRDYVIRAFNDDKPYDLFIKEQIAGDETDDPRAKGDRRSERMVALGFLRMGTWEADANFKTQLRQDFLNEITTTTSSVFLGLTTGCARCHDHKYDPIPTRDFYRLQSFFAATRVDERPAPFLDVEDPAKMRRMMRQFEDAADEAEKEAKRVDAEMRKRYMAVKNLQAGDKAADEYAKALRDKKDPAFTAEERERYNKARDYARKMTESIPRFKPAAYTVSDVVPPHVPAVAPTFVLAGGEIGSPGEKVEPGFLTCIEGKAENAVIPYAGGSSGRRRALADWIASPGNPMTARVMANRIWQHHFGEGLVRTPSDFGRNGDRPSHPELLDWLASEFVERKWSIKAMHRLMLTSATYQQSTSHPMAKEYAEKDPENRLLWRMNWLRLESEVLRDSILSLSGALHSFPGGPGVFLDVPQDVAEGFEFFKWFPSSRTEQHVRTIYTFQRRSVVMPMMEVFDAANMSESCSRRNVTVVPPQAFTLMNGPFVNDQAKMFAARVVELAGPDRAKQIDTAFRIALGREPADSEREKAAGLELHRLGLLLFNLNEFLYLE